MQDLIVTKGLRKSFKSKKTTVEAVRGVDLSVGEGELFGFLGPNGAGKTTTLRMLATLLPIGRFRNRRQAIFIRASCPRA